jgi:hypothetical protein
MKTMTQYYGDLTHNLFETRKKEKWCSIVSYRKGWSQHVPKSWKWGKDVEGRMCKD